MKVQKWKSFFSFGWQTIAEKRRKQMKRVPIVMIFNFGSLDVQPFLCDDQLACVITTEKEEEEERQQPRNVIAKHWCISQSVPNDRTTQWKYDSCATGNLFCHSWNNGWMDWSVLQSIVKDSGCFILHQHILCSRKYYWCWMMIQKGVNNWTA